MKPGSAERIGVTEMKLEECDVWWGRVPVLPQDPRRRMFMDRIFLHIPIIKMWKNFRET